MAADRTFTLIGNFTDNISPSLVKVHRSLDNVKRHIASVTKSTSVLKNEFKELALSSKSFNDSLKGQAGDLTNSIAAIKKYRQELGRLRRDQSKIKFPPLPPPGGGGGYGGGGGRRGGRNGGRSYGGGYSGGGVARDSSFVFSQVLGNQVAGIMTNAIFSGFQMGVGLMKKPFEYFQSALQERIADQQSDIKAAGGYYSIAKRQADGKKFIKTFDEAMTYTQMNNKYMSELAKALPGNTAQYVEISKRLSDSIARIVVSDPKKAIEYANKLRTDPGRVGGTAEAITDTGAKGMRMAMTDLVGEITKKTVLAGLGGGAQGGVTGATGLPGLAERMLTQDQLSFGQLRRYAAIFRDPMISDALERYIPKINATTGSTVERFEIVNKMFDEILPPEVIRAFMRSTAGVLEAFRSTFLDPEVGLFGLGRKFKDMGPKFDSYGNKVADTVEEGLSVFDLLNETFGNVMISIQPLFEILPKVFDPLKTIGDSLKGMRVESYKFLNAFETYKRGLTEYANEMDDEAKDKFTRGGMLEARASFAAINNLFRSKGVFGYGPGAMSKFKENAAKIMSEGFDPAAMLSEFAQTFMDSQIARDIGKNIGSVIRIVLKQISDFLNQLTNVAQSSQFVTGLKEGFGDEGKAAFVNIVRKVFEGLGALLLEVIKTFPLETALFAAFSLGMPALSAGLSSAIGIKIERFIDRGLPALTNRAFNSARGWWAFDNLLSGTPNLPAPVSNTRVAPVSSPSFRAIAPSRIVNPQFPGVALGMRPGVGGVTGPYRAPSVPRPIPRASVAKGFPVRIVSAARGMFSSAKGYAQSVRAGISPMRSLGKFGVVATLTFGVVDALMAFLEGKGLAEAIGRGAGPVIGSFIGAALTPFFPPLGAFIGGWIGSMQPVVDTITGQIKGLEWGFSEIGKASKIVSDAFWGIWGALGDLIGGLIPESWKEEIGKVVKGFNFMNFAFKAVKISFFPVIVGLNWLATGLNVLKLSILMFDKWINDTFQGGNRSGRLTSQIEDTSRAITAANNSTVRVWNDLLKDLPKNNPGGANQRTTGNVTPRWKGGLGDAVASELKHKPPGSNLVIANSSETVIPAAGGYGMVGFITVLRSGFGMTVMALSELRQNFTESFKLLNQTLVRNQAKTDNNFKSLETRFTSPTLPGGLGGARAGGVDAFTPLAQQFGLSMTSGYRPGDPGWHGANRARDFSNGSGPTVQMMQFAQYMASTYGANLKELIYTPLGYSIRNGQIVSPYAQRGHYNHVHVAYGLGAGSPAFFTNRRDAIKWEKSMMPGGAKVSSITSNSSEGFGTTIHAPITIYQQPGQDSEELAQIVVARLGMAVHTISNHM